MRIVTSDDPEPLETNEAGAFVTIRAGGPLEGIVTLTPIARGHGRTLVIASWIRYGHTYWDTVEVESLEHARILARSIADQLAAGIPPDLSRD